MIKKDFNKESFEIFLKSSPDYPSILSVIKALKYIGVNAKAARCEYEDLISINMPCLLHFKYNGGNQTVLTDIGTNNQIKIYNPNKNKWEAITKSRLQIVWDGIVIYSDNADSILNNKIYLPDVTVAIGMIAITVLFYLLTSWLALPIIVGLLASLYLYLRDKGFELNEFEKLCDITPKSDCREVTLSRYAKVWIFKLSDLSLAYFAAQTTLIFVLGDIGIIYMISAIISIPVCAYSLFSQIRLKKICSFCIIVLLSLAAQTLIYINNVSLTIAFNSVIAYGIIFIMYLAIFQAFSIYKENQNRIHNLKSQFLKLKRKKYVVETESLIIPKPTSLMYVGDADFHDIITTVISPSCAHCKELVHEIFSLRNNGLSDFRWNIILGEAHKEDKEIILSWIDYYLSAKPSEFIAFIDRWSNSGATVSLKNNGVHSQKAIDIYHSFKMMIRELGTSGFPKIMINERMLSSVYTFDDIEYLLIDLKI